MIKKYLKNIFGYTLTEIMMTTAVIGVLTAVTVPNFLRIKMNVNKEMVSQHLRVMGEEMNEFYNHSYPHQFPAGIAEIKSGASPEEVSITASLNAIESKGFATEYQTDATRSTYTFTACPPNSSPGDDCSRVDPSGVATVPYRPPLRPDFF